MLTTANAPTVRRRWKLLAKMVKYQNMYKIKLFGLTFFFFFEGGWWNRCQRGKIGEGEEHREKEWCSRAGDQMLQLPEVWLNSESTKLRGVKEGIGAVPASKRWKPYCLNPSEVIRFCRGGLIVEQ